MLVSILPAVLRVPCGRLSGKKGLTLSAELTFVLIHSLASVPAIPIGHIVMVCSWEAFVVFVL